MRIDLGDEAEPEIGLIALIDCIFFLLMFFMVATSFKQQDVQKKAKDLAVQLPTASATLSAAEAGADPLVITVDARGQIAVDGQRVTLQALHDRLREQAARDRSRPVRIDGDKRVAYQYIVHVLDLCQFEGLTQVAMRTRP